MLKNLTANTVTATWRARFISILLLIVSIAAVASAQQRTSTAPLPATSRPSQQSDATTVYRSARDLITDGEWAKAQEKFNEYVSSYPNEKNLDAALYWLAYSQHKLARFDQCRSTIERLLEKYPNTSWKEDARLLLAQSSSNNVVAYQDMVRTVEAASIRTPEPVTIYTPGVASTAIAPVAGVQGGVATTLWNVESIGGSSADDDDPCEFKIVVLQALFQTDVQRGIMAATDWLKPGSAQTVRCKSAALTLLGRNGGKSATPVILGVARNETDLKLRARAISTLGATNDDSVLDALRDFAINSPQSEIVEASLYALSKHTGERAMSVLSEIAINGKGLVQRKQAISSIASRPGEPAVDALFRIYDAEQNIDIRKAVIFGFANRKSERAGNKLFEIARGSDNIELRKAAISSISRRGGDKAVEFLLNLYDTEKNEELRDLIVNSLGYGSGIWTATPVASGQAGVYTTNTSARMNDERVTNKLIEIARDTQAPMERRKRAINWLSRSKDPKVLKFLEELLK
jgi:tetratricopeptide (TPR) repeat protein